MPASTQREPARSTATTGAESALDKEAKIAAYTAAGAVVAALLYWLVFFVVMGYRLGGPDSWAQFGDYFGGLVNPLVGIVTVILVVRTLHATRTEAADTRKQLELQTQHMERERQASDRAQLLAEMRIRLDGALGEWHRVLAMRIPYVVLADEDLANLQQYHWWPTRGEALNDSDFGFRVAKTATSSLRNGAKAEWLRLFHPVVELAVELACYCQEYERGAGDKIVADFYRRRIERAVHVLRDMELLSSTTVQALNPASLTIAARGQPQQGEHRSDEATGMG